MMERLMLIGFAMVVLGCIVLGTAGGLMGWHTEEPGWLDITLGVLLGGGSLAMFAGFFVGLWRKA